MMRYHRIASNVALALASPKSIHRRTSPFLPRPSLVRMSSSGGAADTGAGTTCVERTVTCSDGISLSARCWEAPPSTVASSEPNNRTKKKILCLHGWLDNASSFHLLAPRLAAHLQDTEIVALDLPGHGRSSHKGKDGPTQLISEYCFYVSEFLDEMGWTSESNDDTDDKIIFIGHSMGAGISTTFAASFPDVVDSIILLEGTGPLARRCEDTTNHIRNAVGRRKRGNRTIYGDHGKGGIGDSVSDIGGGSGGGAGSKAKGVRVYSNIDDAVKVRLATARLAPGKQWLSEEAARAMVERAVVPYISTPAAQMALSSARAAGENVQGFTDESVCFRHDPRLQWPSLQYFTREQVDAIFDDVQCPVCLIIGEDGWPFGSRERESVTSLLKPAHMKTLPGSHHFHADNDTFEAVFCEVAAFLER